jgi:hypothetical protein
MDGPGLFTSVAILVVALICAGVGNWQLRRPAHQRLWPAVPWLGVQFVGAAIVLVLAAHLISLISGRPFTSRNGL